ncbi:MAG TPA: S1 RNA-binding domain-containing protein, partial [Polyangiaceae bacterium]|nr:S1 RNA-binding domain-containing protein [Polyangiaceae bacterium]
MSNEPTQNAEPQQPAGDDQERSPSSDAAPKSTSIPPTEASAGAASSSDDNGATENENGGEAKAEGEGGAPAPGEKKKRRRRKKKKGGGAGVEGAQATGAEGQAHPQHQNHNQHQKKKDRRPQESRERPAFGLGDVVFGKIVEITEDVLFIDLSGKAHAVFDRREMLLPEEPAQGPGSDVEEDDFDPGDLVAAPDPSSATPPPPEAAAEVSAVDAAQAAQDEQAKESRRIVTPKASEEPKPEEEAKAEEPAPPPTQHSPTESVSLAAAPIVVTLPPVVLEVGANFVGVVHNDGGRGGLVVLTRHPRRGRKRKMDVAKALREKTTVEGLVTGVIKGGIEVDIDGLRAFAPASHVALHHGSRLQELLGLRLPFFVTQYAKRGTDIVLSRKSMLEAEAKGKREEALKHLVVGNAIVGTVRSVVPFGAFIDIGGIEGLVPLAEMSHNRGDSPGDVFHVNQQVEVLLQRIDAKGKIWLSRKAVLPDPWGEVAKKYADGTRHKGRVARLQPFGAFVELEPGIDGLIHLSDLGTSDKKIDKPEDVVKVGDEIEVFVVSLDVGSHKIGLSPVPPNWPEGQPFMRVGLHRAVRVKVTAYDANGLFVQILGA